MTIPIENLSKKNNIEIEIHQLMNNHFENFCDFSNHNGRSLQHQ